MPDNTFDPEFLDTLGERELTRTAEEADLVGPGWSAAGSELGASCPKRPRGSATVG